jgi:hypothetical protein
MFMPMASRRCEIVGTKDHSLEYRKYHLSRDRLGQLSAGLHDAVGATVVQVDPEEMKNEAFKVLEHKAKSQLRLEGTPYEKRRMILREMREMFESPTKSPARALSSISIGIQESPAASPQHKAGSASASASASASVPLQASRGAASESAASSHLQSSSAAAASQLSMEDDSFHEGPAFHALMKKVEEVKTAHADAEASGIPEGPAFQVLVEKVAEMNSTYDQVRIQVAGSVVPSGPAFRALAEKVTEVENARQQAEAAGLHQLVFPAFRALAEKVADLEAARVNAQVALK